MAAHGVRVSQPRIAHARTLRRVSPGAQRGFTLIELVITVAILTILTLGIIPLVKLSVKRQKEQHLRETLREMRAAIDQFHREALAGRCGAGAGAGAGTPAAGRPPNPPGPPGSEAAGNPQLALDPRIRVAISDQKIFGPDNPDCFPPDLETLTNGVDVVPITGNGLGGRGDLNVNATDVGGPQMIAKKKVYLRRIPVDPVTGEADWDLRSSYDPPDAGSWGGENVFDVRSKSSGTALNGEKYSDW
ncbi:MAG TPA: type II secretion system protein [Pyrinomonadaceae bacterium]